MRVWVWLVIAGCENGKVEFEDDDDDTDLDDADDVAAICAENEPETLTLGVSFPAVQAGCPWGENGNGEARDATFQGRIEQVDSLDVPGDAVVCDVVFDFEGVAGGQGTPMVYDDAFMFTFNDVVLASSYRPLVDRLPEEGIYRIYDWDSIVGAELVFGDIPTWCLGADQDLADCEIPPPETRGNMALSFDSTIVNELGFRASDEGRYDFMFVTMGDNDDTDCSHAAFEFNVELPYVAL